MTNLKTHHLIQRGDKGTWYVRMVINGKDCWKSTRTNNFDAAAKLRDLYLKQAEKLAYDKEKKAIVDQILDVGEDIAMKEEAMKDKHIKAYMNTAHAFAECSSAYRLKVGCIVVKDDRIISIGYNGMPSGWTNDCEDLSFFSSSGKQLIEPLLVTKKEVLHAETNAIAKLAKEDGGGKGATAFVTHAPCLDCAKIIFQSGIIGVYYAQKYKSEDGLSFLEKCNIPCIQVKVNFNK